MIKIKKLIFFCDLKKISSSFRKYFKQIKFLDFKLTDKTLSKIVRKKFLIDKNTCSCYFENIISKNNKITTVSDPIYNFKAIKTKREIINIKRAHIYDGAALTKYLFWIKKNFNKKRSLKLVPHRNYISLEKKIKNSSS